jgi:hypothetical protein
MPPEGGAGSLGRHFEPGLKTLEAAAIGWAIAVPVIPPDPAVVDSAAARIGFHGGRALQQ